MSDAREIADRIVNHWIQFKNLGDSDLIDAIEVALLAERERHAPSYVVNCHKCGAKVELFPSAAIRKESDE